MSRGRTAVAAATAAAAAGAIASSPVAPTQSHDVGGSRRAASVSAQPRAAGGSRTGVLSLSSRACTMPIFFRPALVLTVLRERLARGRILRDQADARPRRAA